MVDYSVKDEVQELAREFRHKRGAMDWSAQIDDLLKEGGLASQQFSVADHGIVGKVISAVEWFKALAEKKIDQIKAMISVKEKVVFVANDLHDAKVPFAKGHELGHNEIPWHKEILYVCDEFDLAPTARAQMEFEANVFSAEVLVPAPLLATVYENFPISMDTVLQLKQWSGASIEVCASKYVESHPGKVALLICKVEQGADGACLRLKRKSLSPSAVKSELCWVAKDQVLNANHVVCQAIKPGNSHRTIDTAIEMKGSGAQYAASIFNTGYTVLVLMFAKE